MQEIPTTSPRWTDQGALAAAVWGLVGLGLLPLWLADAPPLQDYPQHLFNVSVLLDPGSAGPLGRFYEGHWQLGPYTSLYALIAGLSQLVGLENAGRATVSLIGLATAWAILATDRHLRAQPGAVNAPRWGLLLWIPLTFAQCWYLGLINWCLGVPLVVLALVQQADLSQQADLAQRGQLGRRDGWHALVLVALCLTHPFAAAAYVGLATLSALWRPLSPVGRRWGLASAGLVLVLAGALSLLAGLGASGGHEWVPANLQFAAVFLVMPALGMLGMGGLEPLPAVLWLAAAAVLIAALRGRGPQAPEAHSWRHRVWWALLAATVGAYLVLPQADVTMQYFYLNLRLVALIYALAAVLAGHLTVSRRLGAGLALIALALTLHGVGKQWLVGREIGEVLPLVDRLPPEARILPLVLDPTSPELQPQMYQPHIHAGFWHQIRHRAGYTPYVFGTALNPVRMRPGAERPAPPQTQPASFRPAEHWADYDWLLVRTPGARLAKRLQGNAELRGRSGAWAAFARLPAAPGL